MPAQQHRLSMPRAASNRVVPPVGGLLSCVRCWMKHSHEGHGSFPWAIVVPVGDGRRNGILWLLASILIICLRDGTIIKGLRTI